MLPKKSTIPAQSRSNSRISQLVCCHIDTDSEAEDDLPVDGSESDLLQPWMAEYERYINTHDVIPSETNIVAWWGVRFSFFMFST